MGDYMLTYNGKFLEPQRLPGLINERDIEYTSKPEFVVAMRDIERKGRRIAAAGDTIEIRPENTYYRVEFANEEGKQFELFPRAQINENMGGLLASPDIKHFFGRDIYAHASSIPNPDVETEWNGPTEEGLQIGQQFFVNDYVARLSNVERMDRLSGVQLGPEDVAVRANIEVQTLTETFILKPIFIIKDGMVGRIPDESTSIGVKINFTNIVPEENRFDFEVFTAQQDWLVFKVIQFPWVNLLWIGTVVVLIGFGMAIYRRVRENMLMENKNPKKKPAYATKA
jgi:cytochrome c-type biogenesis protein CcmF